MRRMTSILVVITVGLLIAASGRAQDGTVSIDHVTYAMDIDRLRAGHVHQVAIRYNCLGLSSTSFWTGSNGFEIYSPDGLDWGFFRGSAGPLVETAASRGTLSVFRQHFESDNFGQDWTMTDNYGFDSAGGSSGVSSRAGFRLNTLSIPAPPDPYAGYLGGTDNGIAVILEFATDPEYADLGLQICIDSNSYLGVGGSWEWSASGGGRIFPCGTMAWVRPALAAGSCGTIAVAREEWVKPPESEMTNLPLAMCPL